jgi:hypothetical protein
MYAKRSRAFLYVSIRLIIGGLGLSYTVESSMSGFPHLEISRLASSFTSATGVWTGEAPLGGDELFFDPMMAANVITIASVPMMPMPARRFSLSFQLGAA